MSVSNVRLCVVIDAADNASLWTPDEQGQCLSGKITDLVMVRQSFELSRSVLSELVMQIGKSADLTQRQNEIVLLIQDGKTTQQIADNLGISINTVKSHLITLYRTYKVNNRIGLLHVLLKGK